MYGVGVVVGCVDAGVVGVVVDFVDGVVAVVDIDGVVVGGYAIVVYVHNLYGMVCWLYCGICWLLLCRCR